jgi:uncharacterized protein YdaU (DUF1376 family)
MAKTDIWMPLFIGDYLADTSRLTTEQHGAYLLLIMDYWRNGPPPDDDSVLQNITKMREQEWQKSKQIVMKFFDLVDGKYTHSRIDKELSDAAKAKDKAEAKAKKAAESRWSKEAIKHDVSNTSSNAPSIPTSNAQAMHKECPSPSPLPIKSKADAVATRLPTDWNPSQKDIEFCLKERPDLNPLTVAARFVDHWIAQPGVKGRKTDWSATWRNWVRNERQQSPPQKQTVHEKRTATAQAMFGDLANGNDNGRIIDVSPDDVTESHRQALPSNG